MFQEGYLLSLNSGEKGGGWRRWRGRDGGLEGMRRGGGGGGGGWRLLFWGPFFGATEGGGEEG